MTNLTAGATKAQEIEYLEKLRVKIPDQCYLSSLFTRELLDWVRFQINSDIAPDVMATLVHTQSTSSETSESTRKEIQSLEAKISRLVNNLKVKDDTMATLAGDRDEWEEEAKHNRSKYHSAENEINQLKRELDQKDEIILRVKSENYDLTHSSDNPEWERNQERS